jgi:hypothetical protein
MPGNDPAQSAAVSGAVAPVPWYKVEMNMRNRLPCSDTYVHAEIVPIRMVAFIQKDPYLVCKCNEGCLLLQCCIEIACYMPTWDKEGMPFANGIDIVDGIAELALTDDALFAGVAKRAWSFDNHRRFLTLGPGEDNSHPNL